MSYTPVNPNGQATKANSAPVVIASDDDIQAKLGAVTETAPASDTASSGQNGRLQRIAQNLTSNGVLLGALAETAPASDTASAGHNGRLQRVAQNITAGNVLLGAVTETAPANDTASSGLNGRLQRVAQRLTSLIALLPAAFTSGGGVKVGLVDALPAGEAVMGITNSNIAQFSFEITRAANATPYVAGDQLDGVQTISNFFRVAGGTAEILSIGICTDLKSITPRIRTIFYNASPTVAADLDPAKELYTDVAKRIGRYDCLALNTPADATNSTVSSSYNTPVGIPLVAAAGSRDLFVSLNAIDAFTPASGQKITVRIVAVLH